MLACVDGDFMGAGKGVTTIIHSGLGQEGTGPFLRAGFHGDTGQGGTITFGALILGES